jgi:hypothetical protein
MESGILESHGILKSKGILKNPRESYGILKNPRESKEIRRNPRESGNPKESLGIQGNSGFQDSVLSPFDVCHVFEEGSFLLLYISTFLTDCVSQNPRCRENTFSILPIGDYSPYEIVHIL